MLVLQEAYGLDGDLLWTTGAAFGGGMGKTQYVCGAITGGLIALSIREGLIWDEKRKAGAEPLRPKETVRPAVRRLIQGFREKFGAVDCRTLTDCDFDVPGAYDEFHKGRHTLTCDLFKAHVAETLVREFEGQSI